MNAARIFPFLNELRHYSLRDFRADFMAALTVTPMAVPQAMAYALIAGVHPQYGIYACMLPVIVAVLFTLLHALIQSYVLTMLTALFYGEMSEPKERPAKVPDAKRPKPALNACK